LNVLQAVGVGVDGGYAAAATATIKYDDLFAQHIVLVPNILLGFI
jgi:hypothetical protein